MQAPVRVAELPPDTVLGDGDWILADSLTRGSRRFSPRDFAIQMLRAGGDSVYYRAEIMDALVASLNLRLGTAEEASTAAMVNAGAAETSAAQALDSSAAAVALAQAAAAAASGFPVAGYLGEILTLSQNPGAAASNSGKWYTVATEGTLTHASVAGMAVKVGDRILSNGTTWQRWILPPTFITDGSVQRRMLEKSLRDALTPLEDDDFLFAIVDSANKRAFAIRKDGTLLGRFQLDPATVGTPELAPDAVSLEKIAPEVREVLSEVMDGTEYVFAIVDSAGRIGFAVRADGTCVGKFELREGSVTSSSIAAGGVARVNLSADLAACVAQQTSPAMEFKFAIVDSNDRVAFGIREDGTTFARMLSGDATLSGLAIVPGTIAEDRLTPAAARAALSSAGDIVEDQFDGLRRGVSVDFSAVTDSATGVLSVPLPSCATPFVRGVNSTGTALEFSRTPGFVFRGTNYRGTWAAGSVAPASAADEGDWWSVSSSGTFSGVSYVTGDRIVCLGSLRQSAVITPVFTKGKPGEFWLLGEFTPASFSPSSPSDGDAWIASVGGTFSGMAILAGDPLLRVGAAWLPVPREDVKTVPNGAAWSYRVRNSADVQVRRADKSPTAVTVSASAYRTSNRRRTADGIIFRGDSMVATGGLNVELAARVSPRAITSYSWPGGNSAHVITSALSDIAGTDAFRGWFHLWFMGTNDYGDNEATKRGALRAAQLSGSADGRCLFMTVPGQFAMSWNGSRIVAYIQEGITAGTHALADLERWYAAAFPGRHIRTLKALIDRAPSIPSLIHPGKTEAEACALYGAAPFSFFFDFSTKPFTPADLTFVGYRSAAGLPTAGTDGQYYIRNGGGTVGQPIIRWGGAWIEYALDITHLAPAGNRALADAIASFLSTNLL